MRRLVMVVALTVGLLSPAVNPSMHVASGQELPPPGVGIRLVDAPVSAADDSRARVYVIDHVAPGSVIERRVEVSNGTDSTQQIDVYPAAAEVDGDAFTGAEGRTQNELSRWLTVSPTQPELEPDERAMVDVTIEVPSDASAGERYGVVWAQLAAPADDAGVTQVSRVGIRIYLSVGPGGAPPSDFAVTSITAARDDDGNPLVEATVENTGERALDLSGELTLENGPGGLAAGPFTADANTTLGIGQTGPLTVVLDKQLPDGPWLAHITATSGMEQRTAQATITFPQDSGAASLVPTDNTTAPRWVMPLVTALVVLLLATLLALLLVHRRRRQLTDVS